MVELLVIFSENFPCISDIVVANQEHVSGICAQSTLWEVLYRYWRCKHDLYTADEEQRMFK